MRRSSSVRTVQVKRGTGEVARGHSGDRRGQGAHVVGDRSSGAARGAFEQVREAPCARGVGKLVRPPGLAVGEVGSSPMTIPRGTSGASVLHRSHARPGRTTSAPADRCRRAQARRSSRGSPASGGPHSLFTSTRSGTRPATRSRKSAKVRMPVTAASLKRQLPRAACRERRDRAHCRRTSRSSVTSWKTSGSPPGRRPQVAFDAVGLGDRRLEGRRGVLDNAARRVVQSAVGDRAQERSRDRAWLRPARCAGWRPPRRPTPWAGSRRRRRRACGGPCRPAPRP